MKIIGFGKIDADVAFGATSELISELIVDGNFQPYRVIVIIFV
jgi:hypothetical protein